MATDPRAQHYVECTQCDRNAEYHCNSCAEKLCSECKKTHESDKHDVVFYKEKRTVEFCKTHSPLPFIMCCQQCEIPVCQKCIDQNHKKHSFCHLYVIFESKKQEYIPQYLRIKDEFLPQCRALLGDIRSDTSKCKEEIANIQTAMVSKAQALKDIIDAILLEDTQILQGIENNLISELKRQEQVMNSHIAYLQNIVDEYEKYILTNKHAGFILFERENSIAKLKEIPNCTEINLPSFTEIEFDNENIARLFGKVKESTEPLTIREVRNEQEPVMKRDLPVKLIPTATKIMSFTVPGVRRIYHISPLTQDSAWISDIYGNLILLDLKGEKLNEMKYAYGSNGCHATSSTGELVFFNGQRNGISRVTASATKPTLITKTEQATVRSLYISVSNGNLLVAMVLGKEARVIRYKKTGQEVHQIQYDNTGQSLYGNPHYITENRFNNDVCVSDLNKYAVVVVDRDRNYRFSYTGHPPGLEFQPYGISTDTQGRILVIGGESNTVQMIDKDGHFLSFLLTKGQGRGDPASLNLDVRTNQLWVGECNSSEVSLYKYNDQKNITQVLQV